MSSLKIDEKVVWIRLFSSIGGDGYVLDFSDSAFVEFFREHGIEIDSPKYQKHGTSKMKKFKAFWEVEPDNIVGTVLQAILKYAEAINLEIASNDYKQCIETVNRLIKKENQISREELFLKQEFQSLDLTKLNLDSSFKEIIQCRIQEIQKLNFKDTPLSVIFLCGSTLEGLLLDLACTNSERFNKAKSAPREKDKVKKFFNWSLNDLINVAAEERLIGRDIKEFSSSLRMFRNYIHPREQSTHHFLPDEHTAIMCWTVLQAYIARFN